MAGDELWQGSAFLAGPLVHDRAYWSLAAEYSDQDSDSIITSPLAPGSTFTGNYKQTLLFGRVDAEINEQNHLLGRLTFDHFKDTNPADAVGGIALPSAARTFTRNNQAILLGETAALGSNAFNDARLVWEEGDPITEFEPAHPSVQFVRPGVSTEGESRAARLTNRQYQLAETLSLAHGEHFIKVGGDVVRSKSGGDGQEFGSPFVLGQFTFRTGISPSIPTSQLTLADVQRFAQGFGDVDYSVSETLWSVFVQDDYRLRSNLVVNLGLRYVSRPSEIVMRKPGLILFSLALSLFGMSLLAQAPAPKAQNTKAPAPPAVVRVDLAGEKVGGEPTRFLSVVGDWSIATEGSEKVLLVDGRQWKKGQPADGLADKARSIYGSRHEEFIDNVRRSPTFPTPSRRASTIFMTERSRCASSCSAAPSTSAPGSCSI